jgi:pimeloyl-ACP methyl ester carboxylesterase
MPILHNEAEYIDYAPLYDEVAPRIEAAIKFLKDNGAKDIVLVGHSQGASMAAYSLSKNSHDVTGFVAIGMGAYAEDARMDSIKALEKIKIPVLDIFGSEDLDVVVTSIDYRAAAAKQAGNSNYTQVEIAGANHMFDGKEDALIEAIADWLKKLTG